MTPRRVAVLGLGLMGGSLGLALRALQTPPHVVGLDRDAGTARTALKRGAVDSVAPGPEAAVDGAGIVFTAVPPEAALDLVPSLAPHLAEATVVADLSSVMEPLRRRVSEAPDLRRRFVASHPLCGSERGGIEAAREDLYRGRTVLLGAPSGQDAPADRVAATWRALGAVPRSIDPAEHDAILALTSHLPLLASVALVRALRASGRDAAALRPGVGPGLLDTSRVAGSPPALWVEILRLNSGAIAPHLESLASEIEVLRRALAADPSELGALLAGARDFRKDLVE